MLSEMHKRGCKSAADIAEHVRSSEVESMHDCTRVVRIFLPWCLMRRWEAWKSKKAEPAVTKRDAWISRRERKTVTELIHERKDCKFVHGGRDYPYLDWHFLRSKRKQNPLQHAQKVSFLAPMNEQSAPKQLASGWEDQPWILKNSPQPSSTMFLSIFLPVSVRLSIEGISWSSIPRKCETCTGFPSPPPIQHDGALSTLIKCELSSEELH